jgi:hypothetical protein
MVVINSHAHSLSETVVSVIIVFIPTGLTASNSAVYETPADTDWRTVTTIQRFEILSVHTLRLFEWLSEVTGRGQGLGSQIREDWAPFATNCQNAYWIP